MKLPDSRPVPGAWRRGYSAGIDCPETAMAPSIHDPALEVAIGLDEATAPVAATEAAEAVLRLFDVHRDGVHRYVRALGIPDRDAEDVVQDVFLALFHHVARGRPRTNLRGWIFRVGHNLALRHLKREARRRRVGTDLLSGWTVAAPSPEDRYASRQRRARLAAAVNALPARERRCLQLRAEGLRYREIARVLGLSLGTVANTMARALARLRRVDER